jgi:hypothetical protein
MRLIQYTHDLTMTEHSERNITDFFYWDSSFDSECYRMSVHSAEIVTNVIWTTAKRIVNKASKAFICIKENLMKDVH